MLLLLAGIVDGFGDLERKENDATPRLAEEDKTKPEDSKTNQGNKTKQKEIKTGQDKKDKTVKLDKPR